MIMKFKFSMEKIVPMLYVLAFAVAMVLLIFVANDKKTRGWDEYRGWRSQAELSDVSISEIKDTEAEQGILKVYEFDILGEVSDSDSISYYVIHGNSKAYIDDKMVNEVSADKNALIGKTPGSYYVYIPLKREMSGSHVKIVVEPVYAAAVDQELKILLDWNSNIITDHYQEEFWQLLLSMICIISGFIFLLLSIISSNHSNENAYVAYLSFFAILVGFWKLLDVRMMPELVNVDPKILSYVSLTMFYFLVPSFVMFAKKQLQFENQLPLNIAYAVGVLSGLSSVVLQIFNILDYRETLILCHISILIAALAVVYSIISARKKVKNDVKIKAAVAGFIICIIGAIGDFIPFYMTGQPTNVPFTILSFVIFILITGIVSVWDINRKAVADEYTGLFNRGRCNDMLSDPKALTADDAMGVLMLDLNYLKRVNDNYGHEAGDRMILAFAHILRSKLPAGSFAGRYGGDEFVAILYNTTPQDIQNTLSDIRRAVSDYNSSGRSKVVISYSEGSASSVEMPGKTIRELFNVADERMYLVKRAFHEKNDDEAYMKK